MARIDNMNQSGKTQREQTIKLPDGLHERILLNIAKYEQARQARKNALVSGLFTIFAGVLMFPAFDDLANALTRSGVTKLLALPFYDFSAVLGHFRDFSIGILGALPVVNLLEFLAVLLVLMIGGRTAAKHIQSLFNLKSVNNQYAKR